VTELLVKALLCYLLGSVVGSLIIGQLRGGIDIRRLGSGNAGGTNALRTQGKAFALWVLLIDIGKGWLATGVLAFAHLPGLAFAALPWQLWSQVACGLAVILGHIYPLWYGFRGGKGVATLLGAVLGLSAWLLVPMVLTWLTALLLLGFVGFASILGAAALAVATAATGVQPRLPMQAFGVLAALLVLFTHRGNLARMLAGREPRARLWLGRLRSRRA
jgi:acyl phosphate:glycerol-3-phosphate acyltransferase